MPEGFPHPTPLHDIVAVHCYGNCLIYDNNKLFFLCIVFVNGKFCKDPAMVSANDFLFYELNIPGNTGNKVGSNVTLVNVDKLVGLNTLGISLAHLDFAPYGLNPPHTHPRSTELLVVIKGTLLVGFVHPTQTNFSLKF